MQIFLTKVETKEPMLTFPVGECLSGDLELRQRLAKRIDLGGTHPQIDLWKHGRLTDPIFSAKAKAYGEPSEVCCVELRFQGQCHRRFLAHARHDPKDVSGLVIYKRDQSLQELVKLAHREVNLIAVGVYPAFLVTKLLVVLRECGGPVAMHRRRYMVRKERGKQRLCRG